MENKSGLVSKTLVVGILVLFIGMNTIPSIQANTVLNDVKENILANQELNVLKSNAKLIDIPISYKQIEQPFANTNQTEIKALPGKRSTDKIHPAFARTDTGIHMAAYRDEELGQIVWTYSNDDGRTYEEGFSRSFGGDYPTIEHWDQRIFCGTLVTSHDDPSGDVIRFFRCENPKDPEFPMSYQIYEITSDLPHAPPLGEMRDAAIACDNITQNSYYWGAASYTMNISSHNNVPLLLYPEIPSAYLFRMSYYVVENCYHTDIDIDRITHKIFAIYDCYDTTDETWKLYARVKDFLDLQGGDDNLFELQGAEGLQYPVIAANDDTVLILAETEENGNTDIVCLRSTDGLNTFQKSFLTLLGENECFPEIEYVTNNTFICTFIKNEILYKTLTEDGGFTWSEPILIDTDVVTEYKAATISDCASQVLYEKNLGEYIDLSISPLRSYTIAPDIQIPSITGRDEIKASLLNNGGCDESNIYWWLNITGAMHLTTNGIIPLLNASDTFRITVGDLNGNGNINVLATFESPNRQVVSREIVAYLNNNYIENIMFLWDDTKTIYVDDDAMIGGIGTIDHPFISISQVKFASSHGDTIHFSKGTYYAGGISIHKSVRFIGEDKNNTFIKQGYISHTACGNVHTGFTHQGAALRLEGTNNRAIDNIILGGDGIRVLGFSNYVIDNYIRGCKIGIHLLPSSGYHLIEHNNIESCSESGIFIVYDTPGNIITRNTIRENGYAIKMYGDLYRNHFTYNLIEDNNFGFVFNQLHDSNINNNIIKDNKNDGFVLKHSHNNLISLNIFQGNNPDIYLEDSSKNRITSNNFKKNENSSTFHHIGRPYRNVWFRNYWDTIIPFLPKIIFGKITFHYYDGSFTINWINIDWFPAKEPYDIDV